MSAYTFSDIELALEAEREVDERLKLYPKLTMPQWLKDERLARMRHIASFLRGEVDPGTLDIKQLAGEAEREADMRRRHYPPRVQLGRLSEETSRKRIAMMDEIAIRLRALAGGEPWRPARVPRQPEPTTATLDLFGGEA